MLKAMKLESDQDKKWNDLKIAQKKVGNNG